MKTMLKIQALFLAVAAMTACTTMSKPSGGKGLPVVQQQGQKEPVVASQSRSYWLDMRQAKAVLPRIDGALATGESQAAVDLARGYLAKHPGDAHAMTVLAAALALSRNYDLAAYYASVVERQHPGDAVALNIKGLAMMLQPKARASDYLRAADYFQRAMDADQSQIAPGLNLGGLQLEMGNAQAAALTFAKTAARCGGCTAANMGLGIAQERLKKHDAAVASFNAILGKSPNHAGALYNLALVYKNGYNDSKLAEKYLDQLLRKAKTRDPRLKDRAQTVLRSIKGEASHDERTAIAEDDGEVAPPKGNDKEDAELLMSGAEFEDK